MLSPGHDGYGHKQSLSRLPEITGSNVENSDQGSEVFLISSGEAGSLTPLPLAPQKGIVPDVAKVLCAVFYTLGDECPWARALPFAPS